MQLQKRGLELGARADLSNETFSLIAVPSSMPVTVRVKLTKDPFVRNAKINNN